MKILYAVSAYGIRTQTFVSDLLTDLLRRGHDVRVVCNSFHEEWPDPPQVPEVIIAAYRHRTRFERFLDKMVARVGGQPESAREAARRQWRAREVVRKLLRRWRPDVAYVDFGGTAAVLGSALAEEAIPYVVHFHGADVTKNATRAGHRKRLAEVFDEAGALVVGSGYMKRRLVLEGAPEERIRIVRLGVHLDGVVPLSWTERVASPPSVAFLGRLVEKKSPIALIEAFRLVKSRIPAARLTLIGEGAERARVVDRVVRCGLSGSVDLPGAMPRRQALSLVNRHWVYAQHSVTAPTGDTEGFGLSIAEAALLGLPVVSTFHNGIPEQVGNGRTGYLVSEYDYEAMGERIIELLAQPELCREMGEAGQRRVSLRYRPHRRVAAIEALLKAAAGDSLELEENETKVVANDTLAPAERVVNGFVESGQRPLGVAYDHRR